MVYLMKTLIKQRTIKSPCFFSDAVPEDLALPELTIHQNSNILSICSLHISILHKHYWCQCLETWELLHEMPATDTRHQMAGPHPECWSWKPDCFTPVTEHAVKCRNSVFGNIARICIPSQSTKPCTVRLICHLLDYLTNHGSVVPLILTSVMAGPNSWRQPSPAHWRVERCYEMM